ncbi:hypothetical protein [Streptomyces sp. NBC_00525]|uniref:hypothetical protein n=1 Tax=Streptomyces sp. NBC_00525 TaxID=2903660 RepID=UPI002E81B778|nr:hypothetical protein [Streptomyces sp. NBC_00525]WUC97404.1 hypothetical protein OG710_28985 [Streptomyces sp. NBC_00525]
MIDDDEVFEPISLTIDQLIIKLRTIRAKYGNIEVFAQGQENHQVFAYNGVAVVRDSSPHYAMLNNHRGG